MSERFIETADVRIWTEDFGDERDPAVLLIMGAGAQGIRWPDELCRLLAAAGRHVIRYDHRDTGLSSAVDFDANPYTVGDLALDAVAVLDGYGVGRAHLVGASMGGIVAQALALDHPERVSSLTLLMSTPAGAATAAAATGHDAVADPEFLPPTPEVIEALMAALPDPGRTRDEEIAVDVEVFRVLAGELGPWDAEEARRVATLEYDRGTATRATRANHGRAVEASPSRTGRLHEITAPTVVIHGTSDPILPLAHGRALADGIPGARFVPIEGLGHELPEPAWKLVLAEIVDVSAGAAR